MTGKQKTFIETMAAAVKKYAPGYGIKVYSPIIAQAISESGWGMSTLASKYHNYFGMKCGSSWTGKSVNLTTQEEYTAGTMTTIKDNFRAYDSLEEGVKGYFEFISASRYANLKGVTDPETYLKNIKADGYATSSIYVTVLMNLIKTYGLTDYDNGTSSTLGSASAVGESGLKVDGYWGSATTKRLQQIFGTTADGKISSQSMSAKAKNPGIANQSGWEFVKNAKGSQLIRAIQGKVGASADGLIGPNTIKAMQKRLGTTQDGVISAPSAMVKALQTWANNQ